jgi:predicted DNA binding protein
MVVITDIRIPASQFALGRLFDSFPDIEVEIERLVPLRNGVIPLFWVDGADAEDVEAIIRADSMTDDVSLLSNVGGRHLFEVEWSPEIDAVIRPLVESGADVLRAQGSVDSWEFRLQFVDQVQLTDFRERCEANDIDIDLVALYNPTLPDARGKLTDKQHDIIATAYEEGYWEIPRGITLSELAETTGVSSNAASQRLRRGLNTLVAKTLYTPSG